MKYKALFIATSMLLLQSGCSSVHAPKAKAHAEYELTPHREAQMAAVVKQLTAKGYSEERAKRIAAKQIPLVQEQSSEPLVDVLTGADTKRAAEDTKFKKDLDKLKKNRT